MKYTNICSSILKFSSCFLILFVNNLIDATAQQQYGFSQAEIYKGDTLRRTDHIFSSILFDSIQQVVIVPYASNIQQNRLYLSQWKKKDLNGNTLQADIESIPNNRYFYNQTNAFGWEDNSSFYAAGAYLLNGDSFNTFFLQKRNSNTLDPIWFKSFPTQYNFTSVNAIIPIDSDHLIILPNLARNSYYAPEYPAIPSFAGIMKFDTSGNFIWHRAIDSLQRNGAGHAIRGHDGNILICGITYDYGITDAGGAFIMKVDTAGNKLWHKTYNLPGYDGLEKITATADGNYICVGGTTLPPQILDMPRGGGRVLKIDEGGEVIWDTVINDNPRGGSFRTVVLTQNGDVVAFGNSAKYYAYDQYNYMVGSTREPEGWAVRLNANGDVVWNRIFGHNAVPHAHDYLYNAVALSDGGFVAAGSTLVQDSTWFQGNKTPYTRQAAWLVKLDANGCVDTACSEILNVKDSKKQQYDIALYPNPGNGKALLQSEQLLPANTQVSITDIMGRTVWQQTYKQPQQQIPIDITSKASGVYLIRLNIGGATHSLKYVLSSE